MSAIWSFFQDLIQTHLSQPEWLFVIIILSTFVLEDPTTLAVGYLLSQSQVTWLFALSSLVIGIFLGDFGLYLLGMGFKKGFFKNRKWKKKPTAFDLIVARFIPGLRALTFSAAGFFEVSALKFSVVGITSSIIWSALLLWASSWMIAQISFLPFWVWIIVGLTLIVLGHYIRSRVADKQTRPEEM